MATRGLSKLMEITQSTFLHSVGLVILINQLTSDHTEKKKKIKFMASAMRQNKDLSDSYHDLISRQRVSVPSVVSNWRDVIVKAQLEPDPLVKFYAANT